LSLYNYATREKFSALIVDYEAPVEKRYRKNFLEFLTVRQTNPDYDPRLAPDDKK
jgi:hypothetical protein